MTHGIKTPASTPPASLKVCAGLLFIGLTFYLYSPAFHGGFLWDDLTLVTKNSLVRSPVLIVEAFRHFLGEDPVSNFYRPVQTVTYIFDYWRGGLQPEIYRQSNYVIHGLNGVLIFLLVTLLLRKSSALSPVKITGAALLLSLYWLVHPIHSATVAYISGRADSLALMFLLAGWCCWEKRRDLPENKRLVWTLLAFFAGLLAVCSKEAALIGLGFFLLAECILQPGNEKKEKWRIVLGSLLITAIYLSLRLSSSTISEPSNPPPSWLERPALVLRAMGDYLRLLVFPDHLRMERQITHRAFLYSDPTTFDPVYPFLGMVGLLFLGFLGFSAWKKGRFLALRRFGVFWFVFSILPVSNVFALNATVAEHWLYIPSIGFLLTVLGWWLECGLRVQKILAVVAGIWIIGLGVRTYFRAEDWSSPITFYETTIRDGGDTPRIRVNLADQYRAAGRLAEGETLLREVLRQTPKYSSARNALMVNLRQQGREPEADALVENNPTIFGNSFRGKLYAADALLRANKLEECGARLEELKKDYPDSWLLTVEIGKLLDRMNQPEEKRAVIEQFAQNHWWHLASHRELADLDAVIPDGRELAIQNYLLCARLDIRDSEALTRAVDLLLAEKDWDRAVKVQKEAVARDPRPQQKARFAALEKALGVK